MYSALQRLNAAFFHGVTVLFFCAVACNITVWVDTFNGKYQLGDFSLEAHERPVKLCVTTSIPSNLTYRSFLPRRSLRYGPPNQILEADVAVMRFDLKVGTTIADSIAYLLTPSSM